jgi:hypothetical protein
MRIWFGRLTLGHMIELAPQPPIFTERAPAAIEVHELEPLERLQIGDRDHTLSVSDGVLYVVLDEDELALTSGDQIGVRSGELRRAWNAGEATARVVVVTRAAHLH